MNREKRHKRRVHCLVLLGRAARRPLAVERIFHAFTVVDKPDWHTGRPPNTPIMPYATPAKKATFIDPTVSIKNGNSVVIGYQNFIGPYASLDGTAGAIKIGNGSDVLDNASIVASRGQKGRGIRGSHWQFGRDRFWGDDHRAEHDRFIYRFEPARFRLAPTPRSTVPRLSQA